MDNRHRRLLVAAAAAGLLLSGCGQGSDSPETSKPTTRVEVGQVVPSGSAAPAPGPSSGSGPASGSVSSPASGGGPASDPGSSGSPRGQGAASGGVVDPKYDALLNGPLPEETKQQKLAPQIEAASKAAGAYLRARYAFDASTTPTQWSQRLAPVTTPAHLKELRKLARDVGAIPGSPGSDAPGKGEPTRAPGSGSGGGGGRWSFTVSVAGAELSQWFGFTSTSMTIAATYTQQYLLDGVRRGDAEPEAVFVAMRFSGGRWVASRLTQNAPTG